MKVIIASQRKKKSKRLLKTNLSLAGEAMTRTERIAHTYAFAAATNEQFKTRVEAAKKSLPDDFGALAGRTIKSRIAKPA